MTPDVERILFVLKRLDFSLNGISLPESFGACEVIVSAERGDWSGGASIADLTQVSR